MHWVGGGGGGKIWGASLIWQCNLGLYNFLDFAQIKLNFYSFYQYIAIFHDKHSILQYRVQQILVNISV